MDQPSTTTPEPAPPAAPDDSQQVDAGARVEPPGFRTRGRVRRRVRFLRKARELGYRDLGGLVFNLHRFGQRNDALVMAKLTALTGVDSELRALESSLSERRPVTVLHEAGVTACPRCAAIHSGEDRFCPSCGLPLSRHVDLPIGSTPPSPAAASANASAPAPATGSAAGATAPSASATAPSATGSEGRERKDAAAAAPPEPAAAVGAPPVSPPPVSPAPAAARRLSGPPPPPPQAPAAPAAPAAPGEDQPTEILRPPAAGGA